MIPGWSSSRRWGYSPDHGYKPLQILQGHSDFMWTLDNFENLVHFCGKIVRNGCCFFLFLEKTLHVNTRFFCWKIAPEPGYGIWAAGGASCTKSEYPSPRSETHFQILATNWAKIILTFKTKRGSLHLHNKPVTLPALPVHIIYRVHLGWEE